MTFLRQNYLGQVPGVETYYSLLSADPYRLPQPTTAFCTGFLGESIMGGKRLSIIAAGMSRVNPLYWMVISKAFNKVKASGKERVACLILFLSGSIL